MTRTLTSTEAEADGTTTETYKATVTLVSDAGTSRWNLTGTATISATFTSVYDMSEMSPVGPCTQHYTDDASASGSGPVTGGLEIRSNGTVYDFNVRIPGVQGTNESVRDDSGCFGTREAFSEDWSVGGVTVGDSDSLSDPNTISGSNTEELLAEDGTSAGEIVTTWSLTRTPS